MRILIVNQWFAPEPNLKSLSFARALTQRGHEVEVLTGYPNYPGGKVYPGYRVRFLQREVMDGIPVVRVPLYPSHNNSALKRIWNYVSFALSASFLGLWLVKKADVIYAYHPPATIALPALIIGTLRHIPVVYDIQDLWPDTLRATQMVRNATVLKLVGKWCQLTYRQAKKIVVLSPGFKEMLIGRGVSEEKVEVVYNWAPEKHIARGARNEELALKLGMNGKFNVVFAGTMGKAQALETVIEAGTLLSRKCPGVQIVLAGGGIEQENLKRIAREKKAANVLFLPWRPVSEIGEVLNLADVLLVHLKSDPLFRITIPHKIQTYMAVGKPILIGVEGDASNLVSRAGAGIPYDPRSAESLAEAIAQIAGAPKKSLDQMGKRGYEFYHSELSLAKGVERFERIFLQAVNSN